MYNLIYNGNIISIDELNTIYNWIYIVNGIIVDAGCYDGYHKYLKESVTSLDLEGKTVLPSFADSHVYLVQTGINKLAVNLSAARSISDVVELLNMRAKETQPGELVRGVKLDEFTLKEKRLPNKYDLDKYFSKHPIWINRIEKHTSIVNSFVYRLLKLPFNLEGIEYNEGIPTGIVRDRANAYVTNKLYSQLSNKHREQGVEMAFEHALRRGITTLNAMEAGFAFCDRDGEFIHANKGRFPIDVNLFFQTMDLNKLNSMGIPRFGCLFLDGSIGSRTASLSIPYNDDPKCYGSIYYSQKSLDEIILKAHVSDFQLAIHAVGDRAIDMALDAIEKALIQYPRINHRHKIEHYELPSKKAMEKTQKLGVIASMVPNAIDYWSKEGAAYDHRLGKERLLTNNPFRDVLNHGIRIVGGSDSDATEMNPFRSIKTIVTNDNKHQRVSLIEALKMFTIDAAYGNFEEHKKGSIERGKNADVIIVSHNPFEVEPDKLADIKVLETIKDGHSLFKQGGNNE